MVDEETQKNDLDIGREVFKITKKRPSNAPVIFSFAKKADSELTQAGWTLGSPADESPGMKGKCGVHSSMRAADYLAMRISKMVFPATAMCDCKTWPRRSGG